MFKRLTYLLLALLGLSISATAQEMLDAARINAKAGGRLRRQLPALGLPVKTVGEPDAVILFKNGRWRGADAIKSSPHWIMWEMSEDSLSTPANIAPFLDEFRKWAGESPSGRTSVVYGSYPYGWFIAGCTKARFGFGWKSIAFILEPRKGYLGNVYLHSTSVNKVEARIGYNLFPKLPAHLQEIIEEMTAYELLCPIQEFEAPESERPEAEMDFDGLMDMLDARGG